MAKLIMATRQPPGDRWLLSEEATETTPEDQTLLTSLTQALNEIYKFTGNRVYNIDASKGIISIETETHSGPKVWDIYGEHEQRELLND